MNSLRGKRRLIGASAVLALALLPTIASSITAELAKKCRAMAIKAYPTALAGSRKGSAENQREFFNSCSSAWPKTGTSRSLLPCLHLEVCRCPCRRRVKQETTPMPLGPPRKTVDNAGRTAAKIILFAAGVAKQQPPLYLARRGQSPI